MYHLTDDGPKECTATVRSCPYSAGDHHATLEAAESAYAAGFDFNSQKKLYAPAKSSIVAPSAAEIQVILKEFREEHPQIPVLAGDLVAHSQFGSVVYNLDHPDSDNDLFFLVNKKAKSDFQNIDAAKRDIRVSSVYTFSQEYLSGTHFNVDISHSGAFQISREQEWAPFISNLRFNEYEYLTKLRGLSLLFAQNAEKRRDSSRKDLKLIKTSLRNQILANRFQREERVRPVFTDEEREGFYRALKSVTRDYPTADSVYELVQRAANEVG